MNINKICFIENLTIKNVYDFHKFSEQNFDIYLLKDFKEV
jgi:hypothetical protein